MAQSETPQLSQWEPEGLVCLRCAAPNPDRGSRCGNCEENPFSPPELLTKEQKAILEAVGRSRQKKSLNPKPRRKR